MNLRALRRAVALVLVLLLCILRYWLLCLRGRVTLVKRALWTQTSARHILGSLGIHYRMDGQPPNSGLVVANHLSYLDVLIISAAMPCFFVAKMEIGSWPYFGRAARTGGTLFLDRSSLASATTVASLMNERFREPVPVLLFPEGTSTDGSQVLRFHSRLIDPATSSGVPITTAAIRYHIEDGVEERELCWYGDESFGAHLIKVLGVPGFSARIRFGEPRIYADRRAAADQTHAEITRMRNEMPLP